MRLFLLGFGFVLCASAGAADKPLPPCPSPERPMGYRGDGTCVLRDGNPPAAWDEKTGKNVLWKTPLPNWCLGSPILVRDRVFVMSEPDRDHDFPQLLCLDAKDGAIRWQKELDHIAMLGGEPKAEEARKAWHGHLDALRKLYSSRYIYASATNKDEAKKIVEANGCAVGDKGEVGWKGDGSKRGGRVDVQLAGTFNRVGLYFDVWHLGGLGRIGYCYPTPVSDGECVYVATGLHGFACFDLEGQVKWQAFVRGQDTSNAGYGGNDFCKNARSPLLYKDLLISDVGNLVRAFDKKTGRLVWSQKAFCHHAEIVTPVVITTGGKDVLLASGLSAYRVEDGAKLAIQGWANHGATMLVKYDEPGVVFFTGGGEHGGWENKGQCANPPPAAVKFSLDGDKLAARVLWSGLGGKPVCDHARLVYYEGKLYHGSGCILDAATGKVLKGGVRSPSPAVPASHHLLWIGGGRVYGLTEARPAGRRDGSTAGVCQVYDLDGKKLAENVLAVPVPEGERKDRIVETTGGANWGFSYGCPFALYGNRVFIRSNDCLYCLGDPATPLVGK